MRSELRDVDLVLLTDYRGHFNAAAHLPGVSLDVRAIVARLEEYGVRAAVLQFRDVQPVLGEFREKFVVYQSAQDPGLLYKDFIEDVLLAINMCGGWLIPPLEFFRAHHNKVFMELLRNILGPPAATPPFARVYGCLEELQRDIEEGHLKNFPYVVKPSAGAKASGVMLARNERELVRICGRLSRSWAGVEDLKELVKRKVRDYHSPRSYYRHKFIVADYVPDLRGDFKVVVYGQRVYVLFREVRPRDFRASGSGRYEWPAEVPRRVLDFSMSFVEAFAIPFVSLDLGFDAENVYLFEFQAVNFGNTAVQFAPYFWERDGDEWVRAKGGASVETVYADAVAARIRQGGRT